VCLGSTPDGQPRERTPQQLVTYRVEKRWNTYWASRWFAEGLAARPYGPLVAMLKDMAECGSLACDDRVDIHTDQPCTACATRAQDRRTDREEPKVAPAASEEPAAVPGPRQPLLECACRNPLPKDGSTVCWECREQLEAEAAGAALAKQWAAEESYAAEQAAAGAQIIAELEQEDLERAARQQEAAAERAAAEKEQRRLAAEEDARLRAEFAAQHPELASFGSTGPAPF